MSAKDDPMTAPHDPIEAPATQLRTLLRSLIDGDDAPIPEAEEMLDEALDRARDEGRREAVELVRKADEEASTLHDAIYAASGLDDAERSVMSDMVWAIHRPLRSILDRVAGLNASEPPPPSVPMNTAVEHVQTAYLAGKAVGTAEWEQVERLEAALRRLLEHFEWYTDGKSNEETADVISQARAALPAGADR